MDTSTIVRLVAILVLAVASMLAVTSVVLITRGGAVRFAKAQRLLSVALDLAIIANTLMAAAMMWDR